MAEIIKEGRNVFAPPYDVPVYNMQKRDNPPFGSEQMLKNLLEYFLIGILRDSPTQEEKREESEKLSVSEIVNYLNEIWPYIRLSEICKEYNISCPENIIDYNNLRNVINGTAPNRLSEDKLLSFYNFLIRNIFQEKFKIKISNAAMPKIKTVGDVVDLLEAKLATN